MGQGWEAHLFVSNHVGASVVNIFRTKRWSNASLSLSKNMHEKCFLHRVWVYLLTTTSVASVAEKQNP